MICPECNKPLQKKGKYLACPLCKKRYPIIGGIPVLFHSSQEHAYRESTGTVQEYYRQVPKRYNKTHHTFYFGAKLFSQQLTSKLQPYIRPTSNILEIGAGTGFATQILSHLTKSLVVSDSSLEMLTENIRKHKHIKHICCSTEYLPFPDASFDVVVGNNTYYLIPDKDTAAKNIARVLKKNGKLILSEMNPYFLLWPINFVTAGHLFERAIYHIFPFQMKSYFEKYGMTIEKVDYYMYAPYFANKKLSMVCEQTKNIFGRFEQLRRFVSVRIFYVLRKKSEAPTRSQIRHKKIVPRLTAKPV